MKQIRTLWQSSFLSFLTAIIFAFTASATTIVMPSDDALVAKSPLIVDATVVRSNAVARGAGIWTETILQVNATLKGTAEGQLVVREIGGELDGRITKVWGTPEYTAGEHVLAFLTPTPRGDFQTVDLFVGKFTEGRTQSGQRLWLRDDGGVNVQLLDGNFEATDSRNMQRDADSFERFVRSRVRGLPAARTEAIENPVLAHPSQATVRSSPTLHVGSDFTLIGEPQPEDPNPPPPPPTLPVSRWFTFDSGGSVRWYSYGAQTGYTGGGVNEAQTAIGVWDNYSAAKINYTYVGAKTGAAPSFNDVDGVNGIVFNDPNNEIAGTWVNPQTGGVVGWGGFHGSSPQSWTSPFAADGTHTLGTFSTYQIAEGNLVIQDGVSPSAGVTSQTLGRIMTHEFGHTMGFGHSADSSAVMYYRVTGGVAASLGTDDKLGARWLYPSGTGGGGDPTPTIPAAPSGLTATPSGSTASLHWTDNATDETSESIYVAAGSSGGSFSKVSTVAAGTTSATVSGLGSGPYRFYVTASNTAGESPASNIATATFTVPLQAIIDVNQTTGVAAQTIFTFSDLSTGSPTSRSWNFGDGQTSTQTNPSHIYSTPGTYTVTLTVNNASGSSQAIRTINVTAQATLVAAFTYSPTSPISGATVSFVDQSTGGATGWNWNFGDGSTSVEKNPTHVYAAPGSYGVSLTVTSATQSDLTSHTVNVSSPSAPLAPAFTYSPSAPTTDTTVTFTDQSLGGVTAWNWAFGDGTTSSDQNPTHRYTTAGTFTVTLTAFHNSDSAVATKSIVVTAVSAPPPVVAAFDASAAAVSVGQAVSFTDHSTGTPTSWSWNFGDGSTSSSQSPSHTYAAPGTFTVTLSATNGSSSSTVTHTIVVSAIILPYHSLVSVTTQTAGVGGSSWRTELTIFNAGSESASIQLVFVPGAGGTSQSRNLFLAPSQSVTYENALVDIFGMLSGAGGLSIDATSASSTPNLKVSSRTFTFGTTGSYGQAVPSVSADDLPSTLLMTGLESDASFRTNLGIVNRTAGTVNAVLTLIDASGNILGTNNVAVPGNNFQQSALAAYFPAISGGSFAGLSMKVVSSQPNAVSVYASVIDNRSQDPVYIQAVPVPQGSSMVIPVVGRTAGGNGTFWRSDVTFFNPNNFALTLSIRFLTAGADDRNAQSKSVAIAAGHALVLADVLDWLGMSAGSGALEISWSGNSGPVATSRTYTTTTGDAGTYGQSIDPVQAFSNTSVVPGLRSDATFRTNVGLVNGGDTLLNVAVTMLSSGGQTIASTIVQLAPRTQMQYSLSGLFPGVNLGSTGSFTLQARGDQPALFAYGSIIDNGSGDPVFFAGE